MAAPDPRPQPPKSASIERYEPVGPRAAAPEALVEELRQHATSLGFVRLGITHAEELPEARQALRRWLAAGHQATMGYLEQPDRGTPRDLFPDARSVVVVALPYSPPVAEPPTEPLTGYGSVARYAHGQDYHSLLWGRLRDLAGRLAGLAGRPILARPCVDTAPLLERALAERAGIGFPGKSALTIVPGVGTWVLLGELLVDLELPSGTPIESRCGSCTACLDRCPTGAFLGPHALDARRCIAYLTIENAGPIPRDSRAAIGTRVFGCDVCQEVCPFNGARERPAVPELLDDTGGTIQLKALLNLGSAAYRRLVKGRSLRRAHRRQLQRNAAVALGNTGDPEAVPALISALEANPSALVRAHAAWALGRLGTAPALEALARAGEADLDSEVREEACLALKAGADLTAQGQEPYD